MLLIETLILALSSVTEEEINKLGAGLKKSNPGMEKVGVLTPDLRKLYALAVRSIEESAMAEKNYNKVYAVADKSQRKEPADVKAAREKLNKAEKRASDVRQIFWACVREEMNFSEEEDCSLGLEWQLFAPRLCPECQKRHREYEDHLDPLLLLGALLGGRTSARTGNA